MVLFVTLLSCRKENTDARIDVKLIDEVLAIKNESAQKLAYSEVLNEYEKKQI